MKMTDFGGLGGENGLSSRIASRFEAFSHGSYMFESRFVVAQCNDPIGPYF